MINSISSNLSRIGTWVASAVQCNTTPVALVASAAVAQSCYSMTPAQTLAVYTPALISVAESITPVLANTAASINEWFHKDNELIDKEKRTEALKNRLENWIQDRHAKGDKAQAAKRILHAFETNALHLNLRDLHLCSLPDVFYHFNHLNSIDLSHNPLTILPPTLESPPHLKYIYLLGNTSIKKNRPTFKSLAAKCIEGIEQELEIWKNDPKVLGNKELASKRILEAFKNKSIILDLRKLGLTSLPHCIGELTALQTLNLSDNQLTTFSIPPTLTTLRWLGLSNNQLKTFSIPSSLTALHTLYISSNQLTTISIPSTLTTLQELNLFHNQLKTISIPSTLTTLQELNLSHNQLTTISIPSTLTALQTLDLSDNQLKTFSIPSSLTALHTLYISSNQLTIFSIPSTLTALRLLYLNRNQLTSLPAEIGNCLSLFCLCIHNNPDLQTLSMSLGEICDLTFLDTSGTLIPDGMRDSILASCQAKRSSGAVDRLPSQLELWRVSAKMEKTSWPLMSTFDEGDKIAVSEWLTRLARSSDFKCHQQDLAKIVCDILQDASEDSFKALFLTQIKANNECCQDRAAMALNEIYVSWCLLCPQQTLSLKEQLKLLLSVGKTLALRGALGEILQKRPHIELESVEIYLYYEIALREKLGLLTATQSMSYESIGRRDWIDEEDLIHTVQNSYTDHVVDLPIFNHLLEKDESAKKKIEGINKKAADKLERIGPCPKKNEHSTEVLEWNIKQKVSRNERESQIKEYKKTWLQALAKKEMPEIQ